jgi:hypothetical protein
MAVAQEIEITDPRGRVVTFPAGTDPAIIQRVMREGYVREDPQVALDRYRAANPQDPNATVVSQGEEGYPGSDSRLDERANVWVQNNAQESAARAEAQRRIEEGGLAGGVRSLSQGMSYSFSDELEAALVGADQRGVNLSTRLLGGVIPFTSKQLENAYLEELDRAQREFSSENGALSLGLNIAGGILAPGAMAAGRSVAGAENLGQAALRGSGTGGAAGAAYGTGSATGGVENRATGFMTGGVTGLIAGGAIPVGARSVGSMTGAMGGQAASDFLQDRLSQITGRPMTGDDRAVRMLFRGQSPQRMEQTASRFRAQGVEPVGADIGGSVVQSRVRAAATRQTPGREVAEDFASGRREDMQDYVAGLGARISPIEATPSQLDEALTNYQRAASGPAFAAARAGPPIRLDNNTASALWGAEGRRGVASAARLYQSSTDPAERAVAQELAELSARMTNRSGQTGLTSEAAEGLELSVTAADLLRRHLSTVGDPGSDTRRIIGGLGQSINAQMRQQSPEFGAAMDGYQRRARLGDATEIGERFIGQRGYTGDFVRGINDMASRSQRGQGQQAVVPFGTTIPNAASEIDVARAAARAALERAGETARGAPGVLDTLATSRGQTRRSTALLGPAGAEDLREGGRVGRMMTGTANNVNPRAGSNTALNTQDGASINQIGSVVGNIVSLRPLSALGGVIDLFRSAGISDELAERAVRVALDEGRADDIIRIARERLPEPEANRLISQLTPILAGQSGGATAPQQPRMAGPQR